MADDSKSTLIALSLELLRIEISNDHMRDTIGYLGQAVPLPLLRSASQSTSGECLIRFATIASFYLKTSLVSTISLFETFGTESTASLQKNSSMQR